MIGIWPISSNGIGGTGTCFVDGALSVLVGHESHIVQPCVRISGPGIVAIPRENNAGFDLEIHYDAT